MEDDFIENLINDENEFLKEKLVKKLNKQELDLKKLRKENSILKSRVNNIESILQDLLYQLDLKNKINKNLIQVVSDEIEESWLYWVDKGLKKEEILKILKISETEDKPHIFIELKVDEWLDEKKMISEILKNIQNFKKFPDDWITMDTEQLNCYLGNIFNSLMMNHTVIILRGIPSKNQKNYEKVLSNVATLAGIMYYSWEELNSFADEVTGKMALLLESDEEMQILNVHKKNSRLILSIEPLQKNVIKN